MDVVVWRDQDVEVSANEGAALSEFERTFSPDVDLFVLRAAVQTDEAPRKVIVHGCLCTGRDERARTATGSHRRRG